MSPRLADSQNITAISYDQIHMETMNVRQNMRANESQSPRFDIEITYRTYGVTESGQIKFSREGLKLITIENFIQIAMTKAGQGDLSYIESFKGLENLIWQVVADSRNTVVVNT